MRQVVPAEVDDFFLEDGRLELIFPGYKRRVGQVQLSMQIMDSMNRGYPLVAEGPTGVGKSLAGLIPAILSNRRVLYVTATIALQEQLINKDLPLLAGIFPKLSYGLLKGRNNYLCLRKYSNNVTKYHRKDEYDQIVAWCDKTYDGDKSTLPVPCSFWSSISCTSDECHGSGCRHSRDCFATKAARYARSKRIIVTNYNYFLLSDTLEYDYVIADEAHAIADVARNVYGFTLRPNTGKAIINYFGADKKHMWIAESLEREMKRLFEATKNLLGKAREKVVNRSYHKPAELLKTVAKAAEILVRRSADIEEEARYLDTKKEERARLESLLRQCANLSYRVKTATAEKAPYIVRWVTQQDNGYLKIEARPLTVHEQLAPKFKAQICAMSATMKTTTGFSSWRADVGAPSTMMELAVESPFNHAEQCRLVIPHEVPIYVGEKAAKDPRWLTHYHGALAYCCAQLIHMYGGHTLGIFTAWKDLKAVRKLLRQWGFVVVSQGEVTGNDVVDALVQNRCHIALGVDTFRQGVDIPGDALQGVFISKIPFPRRDDPIEQALEAMYKAEGKNAFDLRWLPLATLHLKQAFGRLIRTTSDTGTVVIADGRLGENGRGYRTKVLGELPQVDVYNTLVGLQPHRPLHVPQGM